jgi:hypothetical protein
MAARIVIKCIKIKNKKYHIVETFNRKIVERDTPNKQIHDSSSSWPGTGTSIKCGGFNLLLWTHTPPPFLSHIIKEFASHKNLGPESRS